MKKIYLLALVTATILSTSLSAKIHEQSPWSEESKVAAIKTYDGDILSAKLESGECATIKELEGMDQVALLSGEIIYAEEIESVLIKKAPGSFDLMEITRAPDGF
ncbi:MAG: hypothetical protein A2504_11605 [Bdellovibrionales bacterium RIFOXYD12_FULL_39_22]|nr:MAG: hypothetical protein A2385_16120 [Bdellovibrionales bacterium RIFOXYB1_FULL_39_21]OFZ44516.1 MAG: hypothetical protein A2485_06775 [Bdellovibrionales bacterium RIFOXYC12_FULL_39_17]OFZ49842.1 MAG: hypothetical protein A2404_00690 [Bdellovibrionales bacterium RIFOXYC1_FULL_39_130]OFZ73014.1 MAG: hypothetical protein A2451_15995 [Bdellovibrionales bacterium RIFOXYC2_FULL_39_8]OFZ76847.1 MAG: hypothetical protein A2560_05490 [Bdellovibrionales bacterium RIFOXYD1_FULL_39_84]OFZ95774.1 MAG: